MNDTRTLIHALLEDLHLRNFDLTRRHGGIAQDLLNNLVEKSQGSNVWLIYISQIIEIINLTNNMNCSSIQIEKNSQSERITTMFLFPTPDQIIQPDFLAKSAPVVDGEFQLLTKQDFTVYQTRERIQTKARMTVEYHEGALEMTVNIEGDPDMIRTIQNL
jgi:hypothetical protein